MTSSIDYRAFSFLDFTLQLTSDKRGMKIYELALAWLSSGYASLLVLI